MHFPMEKKSSLGSFFSQMFTDATFLLLSDNGHLPRSFFSGTTHHYLTVYTERVHYKSNNKHRYLSSSRFTQNFPELSNTIRYLPIIYHEIYKLQIDFFQKIRMESKFCVVTVNSSVVTQIMRKKWLLHFR